VLILFRRKNVPPGHPGPENIPPGTKCSSFCTSGGEAGVGSGPLITPLVLTSALPGSILLFFLCELPLFGLPFWFPFPFARHQAICVQYTQMHRKNRIYPENLRVLPSSWTNEAGGDMQRVGGFRLSLPPLLAARGWLGLCGGVGGGACGLHFPPLASSPVALAPSAGCSRFTWVYW
jgi:hypothetical protein